MRLYFDACALGRLIDESDQPRMRAEAAAVEYALQEVIAQRAVWIASSVLFMELARNKDFEKRNALLMLFQYASEQYEPDEDATQRAVFLQELGYGPTDALHIAMAESSRVDILLTTDDRLLKRAMRGVGQLRVALANPVEWKSEVDDADSGSH